jgi:hypothetical protein
VSHDVFNETPSGVLWTELPLVGQIGGIGVTEPANDAIVNHEDFAEPDRAIRNVVQALELSSWNPFSNQQTRARFPTIGFVV